MMLRTRTFKPLFCLTALFLFTSWRAVANTVDVYWEADYGFSTGSVTINQGDTIDIGNLDTTYELDLTGTDPGDWYADLPASDGSSYYYVPITYYYAGTYSFSDQYGDTVTVTVNSTAPPPPLSVAITSPANDAVFTAPANFTVTAVPSGGPVAYSEVDFYVGTNHTGVAYSSPYTGAVTNLPVGSFNISAIVTDNDLNKATNSIQVTVQPLVVTNYIVPVVCYDLYSDGNQNGFYLDAGFGDTHGTMEFAEFNTAQCVSIQLELNPYGLPLGSQTVNVYGFDGGNGTLSISNYDEGALIGVMTLPANLGYGQPATFDVTAFVKSTKGPYFGIWLSTPAGSGDDVFSSLESNYGLPPELYAISPAPPPPPAIAFAGNKLVISWSTNNAFGATLQTSTSLASGATWVPVNLTPVLLGNQWVVTNSMPGPTRFFRLATSN